jgi:hypothetical protein
MLAASNPNEQSEIISLRVTEEFALFKCEHFIDIQLWPLKSHMNPKRWLSNFTDDEKPFAVNLLHSFLYFNEPMMEQLLLSAFQDLCRSICEPGETFLASQNRWRSFLDNVVITCACGENPNVTDSGHKFLRMARQVLGIPEHRIMSPEKTLEHLNEGKSGPIVFLDDFVGSGRQFIATWEYEFTLPRGKMSFRTIASVMRNLRFYYCPLLCSEIGHQTIARNCPTVKLNPAHFLMAKYSALHPESLLWPKDMRVSGPQFIESASLRGKISRWKGFHDLGLAIAFAHSVPDATLPLFYFNENGWKPLIERK